MQNGWRGHKVIIKVKMSACRRRVCSLFSGLTLQLEANRRSQREGRMKTAARLCNRVACGASRRRAATAQQGAVSEPADHLGGARRRRRRDRQLGALRRQGAVGEDRPAGHRRQQARRRRHRRHRSRRAGQAGRLHDALRLAGSMATFPHSVQEAFLQPLKSFVPVNGMGDSLAAARGQRLGALQDGGRVRRPSEEEPGQGELRIVRRRHRDASAGRDAADGDRHQHGACALQVAHQSLCRSAVRNDRRDLRFHAW